MFNVEKFIKKINLRNKQRIVNKKYREDGLTAEVLEMQMEINTERYLYDIPDPDDLNDEGFCQ